MLIVVRIATVLLRPPNKSTYYQNKQYETKDQQTENIVDIRHRLGKQNVKFSTV